MRQNQVVKQYLENRQKEIEGAALYQALAESEKQPQMAEVYRKLATSEEKHASIWEKKLTAMQVTLPPRRLSWRARTMIWLAKRFGPTFILPTLTQNERVDSRSYEGQNEAEAQQLSREEKVHAQVLMSAANSTGGLSGAMVAQMEGRHRASGGNALRAAVLGANDGLVSILSLTMGVAGATMSNKEVLIAGLAGILAGAGSMALGEWLSVQSSRELYEHQIKIEKEEIAVNPEEECEELALIYQAKGLPEQQARQIAEQLINNKDSILDTLTREELGVDPEELGGSAYEAAITSFFLFAGGAAFPILPYLFLSGTAAIYASLAVSAVGLFFIGAMITLMTGRSVWYSGTRQVVVGMLAAALTYGIGRLIGISVG